MAFASPTLPIGGAPRVNLLPRAVTERRERVALLRRWGMGLLGVVAVVVLAAAGAFALQVAAAQRLASENARTTDLLSRVAALQPVSQKLTLERELNAFRSEAMGTDLTWADVLGTVRATLPAGVAVFEYTLRPGALVDTEDAAPAAGVAGTVKFSSGTPTDIVGLIRSIRALPGVLAADGWSYTLSGDEYQYELRVTLDQSVYTGTYTQEADQ